MLLAVILISPFAAKELKTDMRHPTFGWASGKSRGQDMFSLDPSSEAGYVAFSRRPQYDI